MSAIEKNKSGKGIRKDGKLQFYLMETVASERRPKGGNGVSHVDSGGKKHSKQRAQPEQRS